MQVGPIYHQGYYKKGSEEPEKKMRPQKQWSQWCKEGATSQGMQMASSSWKGHRDKFSLRVSRRNSSLLIHFRFLSLRTVTGLWVFSDRWACGNQLQQQLETNTASHPLQAPPHLRQCFQRASDTAQTLLKLLLVWSPICQKLTEPRVSVSGALTPPPDGKNGKASLLVECEGRKLWLLTRSVTAGIYVLCK